MKEIKVDSKAYGTQTIQVSDEDYGTASQKTWSISKIGNTFYAHDVTTYLHRFIMRPNKGFVVDHIDRNGLNNQRENLRICTQGQNKKNNKRQSNNTSGFTGVSQVKGSSRFHAYIKHDRRRTTIGYFGSAVDAAKAYNTQAKALFKEYANLNVIPSGD